MLMDWPGSRVVLVLIDASGNELWLRAVFGTIGRVAWYGVVGTVTLPSSNVMQSLVKSCMIALVLRKSVPPMMGQCKSRQTSA